MKRIKKNREVFINNKLVKFITTTKLEANFTVESSFIAPMALIIFMFIILLTMKVYDESFIEAQSIIARVKYTQYSDMGEDKLKEITNEIKEVLEKYVLVVDVGKFEYKKKFLTHSLTIDDDYVGEREKTILKQDSAEYVRRSYWLQSVLDNEEE